MRRCTHRRLRAARYCTCAVGTRTSLERAVRVPTVPRTPRAAYPCAAYRVRRVNTVHACARQVYSETYRVPVLLLQGYGDDGRPWRV